MKRWGAFSCVLLWAMAVVPSAFAVTPDARATAEKQLKSAIQGVLDVLKDPAFSKPAKRRERRERIERIIKERFDFAEMAKRAMGRHWRKRTPEERARFVPLFTQLLTASYMDKIEGYSGEKILYDKAVSRGPYVWIDTTIETKQGTPIPVEYRMMYKNGEWKVYDVVIEEVSLVSTYRSQFNKIIGRESYDALVKRLQKKLEEIRKLEKADESAGGGTAGSGESKRIDPKAGGRP